MSEPWNEGVRGTQVPPLINLDAETIRVEAGPGTGKTFGLVRRVQRILHPDGLNVGGNHVLVVAFNRVIARELEAAIAERLASSPHDQEPVIRTVHALCLSVIDKPLRILLPHEREAMLYDIFTAYPVLGVKYATHRGTEQALRDHEAKHADHTPLWQTVRQWLTRHNAQLISDVPGLLLDRLHAGDFTVPSYSHVIVDEFQHLTPGEQELVLLLRQPGGHLVALGDRRQSIYRFRGNDREGLQKLGAMLGPKGGTITDIPMTECQRCPSLIVEAANQLMGLSSAERMVARSAIPANVHVVVWDTPHDEACGMAKAIAANLEAHPTERHLVMVTRRQFGYWLRDQVNAINQDLVVELGFSESLLETWSVREAFLFFCLLVDPDAPTWRAWLGYQNSSTGKDYKAPERNSAAYLKLLTSCDDVIAAGKIAQLAAAVTKPRGGGGKKILQRAKRFTDLLAAISPSANADESLMIRVFDPQWWIMEQMEDAETARLDLQLCLAKAQAIFEEVATQKPTWGTPRCLSEVAQRLRYQIATREPFASSQSTDIQVATLWGAKGVTADHVYVLGLCDEAIPGARREEYPGTALEFEEEQRRLFFVSITRCKRTLVLSRSQRTKPGESARLGLSVASSGTYQVHLNVSRFLRDIIKFLPKAHQGETWTGCV